MSEGPCKSTGPQGPPVGHPRRLQAAPAPVPHSGVRRPCTTRRGAASLADQRPARLHHTHVPSRRPAGTSRGRLVRCLEAGLSLPQAHTTTVVRMHTAYACQARTHLSRLVVAALTSVVSSESEKSAAACTAASWCSKLLASWCSKLLRSASEHKRRQLQLLSVSSD